LDEQTRLNTVQLIAACAEYPPAREKFKQCLDKLKDMSGRKGGSANLVGTYANVAIEVITWNP